MTLRRPYAVFMGANYMDSLAYMERFPHSGETVVGTGYQRNPGGKSANAAVACQLLGTRTSLIGKVGDDVFGQEIRRCYQDLKLDTSGLFVSPDVPTGCALIYVDNKGQNLVVVNQLANDELTVDEIESIRPLIKNAAVLGASLESPLGPLLHAFRIAAENDVKIILNAAPLSPTRMPSVRLMSLAHTINLNETEASMILGWNSVISTVEEAERGIIEMRLKIAGCERSNLVITLGEKGAILLEKGKSDRQAPILVPTVAVEAIDTVGAGDSFNGSLVHFLASRPDLDMKEMLRRSCAIAAYACTYKGSQPKENVPGNLPAWIME